MWMSNQLEIRGGKDRYEVVSFVRGFSILTIVLMHMLQMYIRSCPKMIVRASALGGTGVHVFFFCSGFGLYASYLKKQTGYGTFLKKRFGKIYVPYIIVILISAMFPFLYEGNRIKAVCSHVFLYKMFIPEYECSFGVQFWYLSTLFQFYLLFIPICKHKKKIGNKRFCFRCCMTSVVWWLFTAIFGLGEERIWSSFFLQYLWEFVIGMEAAEKLENGEVIRLKNSQLLFGAVLGLGLEAVAALSGDVFRIFNDVPALIGYGALALFLYNIRINRMNKVILFFSEISYELYLVHILIFSVMFQILEVAGISEWVIGSISFLLAVIIAFLYHRSVRTVTMRMKAIRTG